MATRSTIAYKEGNTIRAVYCHWDGYPEHVGRILHNYYQEARKIGMLIEMGDISSLGATFGEQHDFNDRDNAETYAETRCTFYNRDRGEDTSSNEFETVHDWVEHYSWSDYCYLWNGREWIVSSGNTDFERLEDVLERKGALEA